MKILTVIGTRPEIIRLSKTIKKLNAILGENHKVIYTNQNNDINLSTIFLKEFDIVPDLILPALPDNKIHNQLSHYTKFIGDFIEVFKPNKALILGDTNSALTSVFLERSGVKVYHVEAGNRCYEEGMVEEINRKIVDNVSYRNLCYTTNSKNNLLEEGYKNNEVYVVGNPIKEVLEDNLPENVLEPEEKSVVITLHRGENLQEEKLRTILKFLTHLFMQGFNLNISMHPRLEDVLKNLKLDKVFNKIATSFTPTNHKDFLKKMLESEFVITDSGTVPEECYYLKKKCIVLRNSFERKEILESGHAYLMSLNNAILNFDDVYKSFQFIKGDAIVDYDISNTSDRIVNIMFND